MTPAHQHPLYFRRAPVTPVVPKSDLRLCDVCGGMFVCAASWKHVVCAACVDKYMGPPELGNAIDEDRDTIAAGAEYQSDRRAGLRE